MKKLLMPKKEDQCVCLPIGEPIYYMLFIEALALGNTVPLLGVTYHEGLFYKITIPTCPETGYQYMRPWVYYINKNLPVD